MLIVMLHVCVCECACIFHSCFMLHASNNDNDNDSDSRIAFDTWKHHCTRCWDVALLYVLVAFFPLFSFAMQTHFNYSPIKWRRRRSRRNDNYDDDYDDDDDDNTDNIAAE